MSRRRCAIFSDVLIRRLDLLVYCLELSGSWDAGRLLALLPLLINDLHAFLVQQLVLDDILGRKSASAREDLTRVDLSFFLPLPLLCCQQSLLLSRFS